MKEEREVNVLVMVVCMIQLQVLHLQDLHHYKHHLVIPYLN